MRRYAVYFPAVKIYCARLGLDKTADDPERGCFAAAGGSQQGHKTCLYGKNGVVNRNNIRPSLGVLENFAYPIQDD
jgi:hypothetical protein